MPIAIKDLIHDHWPEGCEFFKIEHDIPHCYVDGFWQQIDNCIPLRERRMAAHVAHSWFTRNAEKSWARDAESYACECERSAFAWAEWGGI